MGNFTAAAQRMRPCDNDAKAFFFSLLFYFFFSGSLYGEYSLRSWLGVMKGREGGLQITNNGMALMKRTVKCH